MNEPVRKIDIARFAFIVVLCFSTFASCREADGTRPEGRSGGVVITIDTLTRFQTMTGWEAVAQAGQDEPQYRAWRDELIAAAVDDLGINRLRLEVSSGSESDRDHYALARGAGTADPRCERYLTINDNTSATVIDPTRFHFSRMDTAVVNVVLPFKKRLEARGEKLFLNLNYVAFISQCGGRSFDYVHADPAEYAEFILATFLHLRQRYGLVPDAVEVILEPDRAGRWNGQTIGRAMVHAAARLAEAGIRPLFIAPSTSSMANAVTWSREMLQVPGVAPLLSELSYHRYAGVSQENLRALASLAARHRTSTAMLEHIGSDVDDLHEDITIGNTSGWQQFALAYPAPDNGAQYFTIADNRPRAGSRTRYLRQYFHFIRRGARRLAATSGSSGIKTAAFTNPDGTHVVVVHTRNSGSIEIRGLAAGVYGASITTRDLTGSELGDIAADTTGSIIVNAPDKGVLTVYGK